MSVEEAPGCRGRGRRKGEVKGECYLPSLGEGGEGKGGPVLVSSEKVDCKKAKKRKGGRREKCRIDLAWSGKRGREGRR